MNIFLLQGKVSGHTELTTGLLSKNDRFFLFFFYHLNSIKAFITFCFGEECVADSH